MFDFLRPDRWRAPPEQKVSATGRVIAWGGSGRVAWSPRDTITLTRQGFMRNPVAFRAVRLIAEAGAALPLLCQDDLRRYETHPVLDLINRPNGAQGRGEFLEALYGFLLLGGNGYVEAVAGMATLPGELHVLRPDRMSLIPGEDGWPVAYDYAVGGRAYRFALENGVSPICHIRLFHPQDDHYGFSPLQAAAVAVDVHNAASEFLAVGRSI
jgi:HK97 family phage portal protein